MNLAYPKSFPNLEEEQFLLLVLSRDEDFPLLWTRWTETHVFDDIDPATMHLLPLVHIRMRTLGMQSDPLYGKIKGVYKNAWVRNQQLLGLTRNIAAECEQQHIPIMLLKGLALLLDVYQDMGARFTGDADIAVNPNNAQKVVATMQNLGWHYQKPWMPDGNNPVPSMYQVSKSTDFDNHQGTIIDMHWNIFGLYHHVRPLDILLLRKNIPSIAFQDIAWKHAVPLQHSNFTAVRLCNEDMLIHIIIHGSENGEQRTFRWVTDAAMIIKVLPIDWDIVLSRARNFNFTAELLLGFRYLHERMNISIPESFIQKLQTIPIKKYQIKELYSRGNMFGGDRFSPINNLLMFWYAYWMYEPKKRFPKTIFGYLYYTTISLGINRPKLFLFVIKKYCKKIWRRIMK